MRDKTLRGRGPDPTGSGLNDYALAVSRRASCSALRLSAAARAKLSTCAMLVALAIGAVTPSRVISQARATSAGLAPFCSATSSRVSIIRSPRGLRYLPMRLPRWLCARSDCWRYLPVRKPDARLQYLPGRQAAFTRHLQRARQLLRVKV